MRQSLVQFTGGIVNRFLWLVPGGILALSDVYEQHIRQQLPDWARLDVKIDPSVGLWLMALGVLVAAFLTYHEEYQGGRSVRGQLVLDGARMGILADSANAATYELGISLRFANLDNEPIDCELLPSLVGTGTDRLEWVEVDPTSTVPPRRSREYEHRFTVAAGDFGYVAVSYALLYGLSGRRATFRREGTVRLRTPQVAVLDRPTSFPWSDIVFEEPRPIEVKLNRRTKPWRPVLDRPEAPHQ